MNRRKLLALLALAPLGCVARLGGRAPRLHWQETGRGWTGQGGPWLTHYDAASQSRIRSATATRHGAWHASIGRDGTGLIATRGRERDRASACRAAERALAPGGPLERALLEVCHE